MCTCTFLATFRLQRGLKSQMSRKDIPGDDLRRDWGAFRFYEENLHNVMILQVKYIVICKSIFPSGWRMTYMSSVQNESFTHSHHPYKTDHLYAKSTKLLRAKNYGFNICFIEEIDPFSLEKPVQNQCVFIGIL
jgi:hypothetical protein